MTTETGVERATLTVAEMAALLGLGENAAYEYLIQGKIPCAFKLGKRWVISKVAIQRWLENGGK